MSAEPLSGNPSLDWLRVRRLFDASGVAELKQIARLVIYLNRGPPHRRFIGVGLATVWHQIVGSDGDLVTRSSAANIWKSRCSS
jgi:hypothetical protein